jgi:hypothetical protein
LCALLKKSRLKEPYLRQIAIYLVDDVLVRNDVLKSTEKKKRKETRPLRILTELCLSFVGSNLLARPYLAWRKTHEEADVG